MPIKPGDYQELKYFQGVIDDEQLKELPGYAVRMLWMYVRHANFPSGWSWPGQTRASEKLGVNTKLWLKGLYILARFGFFKAWGYAKTKGRQSIAFKLGFRVPGEGVPNLKDIKKDFKTLWGLEDDSLTSRPLLAYFKTLLGEPLDPFEIEKDITLKNPKEPTSETDSKKEKKKEEPPWLQEKKKEHPITEEMIREWSVITGGYSYDFRKLYEENKDFIGVRK